MTLLRLFEAMFLTVALAISMYFRSIDDAFGRHGLWELISAAWTIAKFYYVWLGYIFLSILVFAIIEFLTPKRLETRRALVLTNAVPIFAHGIITFFGMDIRSVQVDLWLVFLSVTAFNTAIATMVRQDQTS